MKKFFIFPIILWIFSLILLTFLAFILAPTFCPAVGCLLAVPLLGWIPQRLLLPKRVSAAIAMPVSSVKGQPLEGTITLQNPTLLPISKVYCTLEAENSLTGERTCLSLSLSVGAKSQATAIFRLTPAHCGQLTIRIAALYAKDPLHILPLALKASYQTKTTVFPQLFPIPGIQPTGFAYDRESDLYSQTQRGSDGAEVFAYRAYTPGDSLRQIHWKLSSHLGKTVVRENSLPVQKNLLVFWDKSGNLPPQMADALAEVTLSVCQSLCDEAIPFHLGWNTPEGFVTQPIGTAEELLSNAPALLKTPCGGTLPLPTGIHSAVIYCTSANHPDAEDFLSRSAALVLFGGQQFPLDIPSVCFHEDNYQQVIGTSHLIWS